MTTPPASGLKLHLASWDPNGNDGAGLGSGSYMATWKNRGSGVADAAQAASANQPQWKAHETDFAVQFDSVSDTFSIASSTSTLKFIHETATFDIFLALRGGCSKYSVPIGNAYGTSDLGFFVERNINVSPAPLTFWLMLGGGAYRIFQTATYFTPTPSFDLGVASKILFRCAGVGSRLSASVDFSTFVQTSGTGVSGTIPTLPTGDATNNTQLGALNGAHYFGGDFLDVAIYNRNLSAGELTTMATYFSERYGL